MANTYYKEPATKGKILMKTTCGDIDIELWPKETPKTCRNFVQLCLENYYDNTIFHRVLKDCIVQGGDPSGTGEGGDSIYDKPFKDEFHSRLRFTHRGIVAMASSGPNTNRSQFFFTLSDCFWLNKKHTIFGKVTGNTVFNMLELGKGELDEENRPLHPHKIISTEVLLNPFDDIKPRKKKLNIIFDNKINKTVEKPKKSKNKKILKRNISLLSFADDDLEDKDSLDQCQKEKFFVKKKFSSAHDDPKMCINDVLLKNENLDNESTSQKTLSHQNIKNNKIKSRIENILDDQNDINSKAENEEITNKAKNEYKQVKKSMILQKQKAERVRLKRLEMLRKREEEENKPLTALQKRLQKYKKRGKEKKDRQKDTLAKLKEFSKVIHALTEEYKSRKPKIDELDPDYCINNNNNQENEEDIDDENWLREGKLNFPKRPQDFIDFSTDDYVIFDPKKK